MDSIWHSANFPTFPVMEKGLSTEVLIIGGGMAGLLCAWHLQKKKIPYVLVEAKTPMGGVSGCTTAKITSQHGLIYSKLYEKAGPETARLYLEANENAVQAYRNLCREIPCDFVSRNSFVYSLDDRTAVQKECQILQELGYPAAFTEAVDLPFSVAGAVKFPGQAQFHPVKFAAAISENLNIYQNTKVQHLLPDGAVTNRGKIRAKKIIVATHFPICNKHGMYFLKQYQQRSYVLALKNAPQLDGMYVDAAENGLSFRNYGELLLLGGGGHRTGKPGGNWDVLRAFAKKYFPEAGEVTHWATQDCIPLDNIPYIGKYSKSTPNLFVATGFQKWGMTTSMVAAKLLTDLVQGKSNPYAKIFSPSRSMLHPQLGANILETTKNLLTLTPKRCPHLGCALKWNPAEHSWDCPCHGSRFSETGELLNGPAADDLQKQQDDGIPM